MTLKLVNKESSLLLEVDSIEVKHSPNHAEVVAFTKQGSESFTVSNDPLLDGDYTVGYLMEGGKTVEIIRQSRPA